MRFRGLNLALACGLLLASFADRAQSQGPAASLVFRNELQTPVIIQGISNVGGMIRRGQPILVAPGRVGGDFNVPAGVRSYSVYDANQPSRVLAKDVPIVVPAGGNVVIAVRLFPNNQVGLVPEPPR